MISLLPILAAFQLITYGYFPHYAFGPIGDTFEFPTNVTTATRLPAFLVCTNAGMNLSNAIIAATFTVQCDPDTMFRFGGEGGWNTGPAPANARLFFSAFTGYSESGSNTMQEFFHSASVEISTNTGTATLVATFNPSEWTDAGGCDACPPPSDADFWNAVANVHEVGIAFGGGDFYDVGIATTSGSATLHLDGFFTYPRFKGFRACFSEN